MTPYKNPIDLNLLSVDIIILIVSFILASNYFNPNFEKLCLYNESY